MARQPLRDVLKNNSNRLPLNGSVIGGTNYFVVSLMKGLNPVDGLKMGYDVIGHTVEDTEEGEVHMFRIVSSNQPVAEFIARYEAAPSNPAFVSNRPEIQSVEELNKRFLQNSYKVEVLVPEEPGAVEQEVEEVLT